MTISMSEESQDKLIMAIRAFINTSKSHKRPLVKWQHILGWINWGLNVFPLLCPALQSSYAKIAGKHIARGSIHLNRAVIHHFNWLADTIEASDSVHMLDAIEWNEQDANLVIYYDASLSGLGFVAPQLKLSFYVLTPDDSPLQTIFFFKALCISAAILWALGLDGPIHHLLIFTDSLNCVEMINSLSTQEGYNEILLFVMRILVTTKISLQVFHVPGADNVTADALSRNLPRVAVMSLPGLEIHLFEPPRGTLGQEN